jgi:tRNA-dihydrouridine synthase C
MTPSLKLKIDFSQPLIFLAPMEGVVDWVLRDLLTQDSSIDMCVTEFVRVTNHLIGDAVFFKYCPELKTEGRTSSGTPVMLQLLGSDPVVMAENACKAVELGALGIDLNFGCPAKTVNNHDGGAALLKAPERLNRIISAVRRSVPKDIPVAAKIRLGFDSKDYVTDLAAAVASAESSWLCIHARTKMDGYKPPAYWEYIASIPSYDQMPLIANGEVWTKENYHLCRERSKTPHVMIGRGLVANPGLAHECKFSSEKKEWTQWSSFILQFIERSKIFRHETYAVQRAKQLVKMMGQSYGEALLLLENIKRLEDYSALHKKISEHFAQIQPGEKIPAPQLIVRRTSGTTGVVSSDPIVYS